MKLQRSVDTSAIAGNVSIFRIGLKVAAVRHSIALFVLILAGALALAGSASADPLNGQYATIVCGSDTYVVVSNPNGREPTASVVSINGVPSTRQAILILDKTTSVPQTLLTQCTAFPPPPDEPFTVYFLLTPPTH